MSLLREIAGALRLGLASDVARPRHVLLVVAGFFIASLSLVGLLAIPAGLDRLAGDTGMSDVALVLSATASDETNSSLSTNMAHIVSSMPGIASGSDGRPLIAPQYLASTKLRYADGSARTVLVRGISSATWNLLGSHALMRDGRRPRSGINELMVGTAAAKALAAVNTGASVKLRESPWLATGEFSAGGSLWESELWAEMGALQSAYNAQGQISVLWVRVKPDDGYKRFVHAMHVDPRLSGLRAVMQRDYYASHVGFVAHFARVAVVGIAATLGLGAVLAIANALSLALGARQREMGVLRAVGFRSSSIGVAALLEVVLIGALSAAVATAVAWVVLDGMAVGTSTTQQSLVFRFRVTFEVMGWALAYATLLGSLSALWPTWRVTRTPLVNALRGD